MDIATPDGIGLGAKKLGHPLTNPEGPSPTERMQGSVRVRILLAAIAVELSYAFGLPLAYVAGSA
ncbi:MAG: hypothetical protein AABY30_05300, partial [Candidatus Thermoplasmatota archaeon]